MKWMRSRWAVAACLAPVLGLAGCGDDEPADTAPPTIEAGDRYVAIGDSYTSGPRIGETSGKPGCEQTTGNYPHLLAAALDLDLVDVSCGGATTESLTESQTPPNGKPVAPQLDALTTDTDLVTLSIGGNDGKVFGNLVTTCVGLASRDPEGSPCATLAGSADAELASAIAGLADKVADAAKAVRERAPEARVVVIGYPQVFPATGTCDELPLATGDYPFARDLMQRIVAAQEAGAEQARVEYVDVWAATDGRDICADEPWVAGITPVGRALSYHPYAAEQQAVADLLQARVGD
ncbi:MULTISPECIES: SGNH/GDSL hydrolase family protein [unclassified Nocardioides]|uniref:SGNH/GDSL hydrolase family protein n=1 Tax=unclassified Nocardioides TaxID=2615069 RepID=UPI0006F31A54|nr:MULTISPECIES: SGNH/GDSL hydrolase family protein [unclassified Nocardioides]KRA38722.1 hypothetical protein ASD81_08995 [Nocardioides sp. Root614]KRA92682.1 hypothetical protein ASD84_09260 [Nocardioides sp. Root682]